LIPWLGQDYVHHIAPADYNSKMIVLEEAIPEKDGH